MKPARTLTLVLLAAPLLASCTSKPPVAPGVLDAGPSSLEASDAYPLVIDALENGNAAEQTFAIRTGNDEGATGKRTIKPSDTKGVVVVSWTVGDEPEPRNESHLERNEQGALVVLRMPNRERDVVTRFDPPFVHLPASLERNQPAKQDLTMLIADFDKPGTITRRGDSTSTITLLGGQHLTIGGEDSIAVIVRAELVSTFGPAKVNRTTDRWFVTETGFVGERFTETVRIFGIQSEKREQEIWLDGVERPDDPAPTKD